MQERRALLKRIASVTNWDTATRATLEGESWIETRNTIYRFRDGVCVDVACRDRKKRQRASILVGMRLVAWLVSEPGGRLRLSYAWRAGASAVLWRAETDGTEEAMAMTSPANAFTIGASPACLQALHDTVPPDDSQTFGRAVASGVPERMRPRLPSISTQSRT